MDEQELQALLRDASRYQWLRAKASQNTAYDIYGSGGHWTIGFFSPSSSLSFDAAVDAASQR